MSEIRPFLRGLTVFQGDLPLFDAGEATDEPADLFVSWLRQAVEAGVPEPHAMVLSTVGADGAPSARVLILKNVDADGWQFAVHAGSPKGVDLQVNPVAALTFHWKEQARQVRVSGPVAAAPAQDSAADFLARPPGSRAEALLGRQSQALTSPEELDQAIKQSRERVDAEPDLVERAWTLYTLRPDRVEFWQGDRERQHTRVEYRRSSKGWERQLLWP